MEEQTVLSQIELDSFKEMMKTEDTIELQKEVARLELVISVIKSELLRRNILIV